MTKPCSGGCGRPRDRQGQNYCHACHSTYMRGWRARKKLSGLDGLALRVLELQQSAAAELDLAELGRLAVKAAGFHCQITRLENELAELARRYFNAH